MEVLNIRNDSEAPGFRVVPDGLIGRFLKADISHVFRVGECIDQTPGELVRKIVIE